MSLPTVCQAFAVCSARISLRASKTFVRAMSSSASRSAGPGGGSQSGPRKPVDRHAVATPAAGGQAGLPVLSGSTAGSYQRSGEKHFYKGRTYSPQDLNMENIYKEKGRRFQPRMPPPREIAVKSDVLHKLRLRPSKPSLHDDSYKNPILLGEFVSSMGKIMPRAQTKLTLRSQKEIGKAIRRARSMGLMPMISKNSRTWNVMRPAGAPGR